MTTTENPDAPEFVTGEGLRALLIRLNEGGSAAWRTDPDVPALMEHVAQRYRWITRRYHLDPWEAVTAAYQAMQDPSTRKAINPWKVIGKAVRITCKYEERAQGMLCSVDRARKKRYSVFHDAERFADRDQALLEFHAALQIPAFEVEDDEEVHPVVLAVEDSIMVFCYLGWPAPTARDVVEYICQDLVRLQNRTSAVDALRRDTHGRLLLDVPRKSWNTAIRVLLGNANPSYAATRAGRGLLMRLALEEPLESIYADDELVRRIATSAPQLGGAK